MRMPALSLLSPTCLLATGFGLGLAPWMPGTLGALLAFPLTWIISGGSLGFSLVIITLLSGLGVAICGAASLKMGTKDPGAIVWDELCGAALAMACVPAAWGWWIAAFLLFRLFDILKPGPIGWLERNLAGGLAVMADDLAAGATAGVLLAAAAQFLSG